MIDYLSDNYIVLIALIGMIFLLLVFPLKNRKQHLAMVSTLTLVFLLSIAVFMDGYIETHYYTHTPWRTFFSFFSYTLKVAAIGSLLLQYIDRKKDYYIVTAAVCINFLVYSMMFYNHWVCWFDENNFYQPGPLRFFFFVPCTLFFLMLLQGVYHKNKIGRTREAMIMVAVAFFILTAATMEIFADKVKNYSEGAICLGCVFYYIEVYTSSEQKDVVTGLLNRHCYTTDITRKWKKIECVISCDLNNLKVINDKEGHEEGDKALNTVGGIISKICTDYSKKFGRYAVAYRVGGDEISIIFYKQFNKNLTNNEVETFIDFLQDKINQSGYSIAAGYAMNEKNMLINEVLNLADMNMYANKKAMKEISSERK